MFQALRQDNAVYILNKRDVKVTTGQVSSITAPVPKPGGAYFEQIVDITVTTPDGQQEFKQLPAAASIANFGNIIISDSKDTMQREVEALKNSSRIILDSIDYHKKVVENCDTILIELNPELAKAKERETEIADLRAHIDKIERLILSSLDNKNRQHESN